MKKLIFLTVLLLLVASYALAQGGTVIGNTAYIPTVDNMGAHENGGRGCAGCHAPHSGGRGSGGNIISSGTSYTAAGVAEGDSGLWGTDTNPIQTANGGNITFTGSYPVALGGLTWASGGLYTGVATCLSCHDGNYSTGAMMSGVAYEQTFGLLNFASVSNLTSTYANGNWTRVAGLTGPQLYGTQPIPTLLGNDGGTLGDYANDHPIGPAANMVAVLEGGSWASYGVTISVSNKNSVKVTVASGSTYANMVQSYGYPAVASTVGFGGGGTTDGSQAMVVCTTCHNQHVMNVYQSAPTSWSSALPIGGVSCTTASACERFQTIFFVNGPYNPGAPYDPKHLPSTMRFCQQCHFNMSPESYGGVGIGTAM